MKYLETPLSEEIISTLEVGDIVSISGWIYCGRDAVLPKIIEEAQEGTLDKRIDLKGGVIFHTAVSPAGVGPTSSNKKEIEESFGPLAELGIKLFLGKGAISQETIDKINKENAVFAVIPPTTALFEDQTFERELMSHPELGMEAFYRIRVQNYQAIIAAAKGRSIYE